jgi:hypothetical protein
MRQCVALKSEQRFSLNSLRAIEREGEESHLRRGNFERDLTISVHTLLYTDHYDKQSLNLLPQRMAHSMKITVK